MSFETIKLTDAIGTEIRSTPEDLLTPSVAAQVRATLIERGVVVIRRLNLADQQQVALAKLLGAVREEGEQNIFKVTLDQKLNANADYLKGSFHWHIDGTHDDVPVFATLLSGRVLSAIGGRTEFANSYAAYEAMSPEKKARLEALKVVHSVELSMRRADIEVTPERLSQWRSRPDKAHPLVWTHASGRKSLVIGCHASHVVGMDRDQGRALLDELLEWTTQPRFVYRHEWSVGDLVIWDNTGVLHRAEPYPADSGRVMHRTTLQGEEAFA